MALKASCPVAISGVGCAVRPLSSKYQEVVVCFKRYRSTMISCIPGRSSRNGGPCPSCWRPDLHRQRVWLIMEGFSIRTATCYLPNPPGNVVTTRSVYAMSDTLRDGDGELKKQAKDMIDEKCKSLSVQDRKKPYAGETLNLAPGEELTALTQDEMAAVCDKLHDFVRSNPDRVGNTDGKTTK